MHGLENLKDDAKVAGGHVWEFEDDRDSDRSYEDEELDESSEDGEDDGMEGEETLNDSMLTCIKDEDGEMDTGI
jgi:hypothetical protein